MQPASTALEAGADSVQLDSMSADEQRALLEKLLAAKQQPLAQQSADLLQGQVSAAQTASATESMQGHHLDHQAVNLAAPPSLEPPSHFLRGELIGLTNAAPYR